MFELNMRGRGRCQMKHDIDCRLSSASQRSSPQDALGTGMSARPASALKNTVYGVSISQESNVVRTAEERAVDSNVANQYPLRCANILRWGALLRLRT